MSEAKKVCNTCLDEKALSEFHKNCTSKDGHVGKCKACTKDQYKKDYKPVTGNRRPVGVARRETDRQRLIARHGIAVVEAMDGLGDCE